MFSTRFILAATFAAIAAILAFIDGVKAAVPCATFDYPKFHASDPYPPHASTEGPYTYTCNAEQNCIWLGQSSGRDGQATEPILTW